jgi:uncharacterized membrane protein HdeD (DUF308 family)
VQVSCRYPIFGAVLIVTATLQLIHAFQIRVWPRSAWYGLSGVLYAIGGILVVVYTLGGALTLAVLIAIVPIAEGALRVAFGMVVRPLDGWGWLIFGGFGSIVVAVILLIGWPVTALWVTGLLLGINLIITGVINTTLALASRTSTTALLTARGA